VDKKAIVELKSTLHLGLQKCSHLLIKHHDDHPSNEAHQPRVANLSSPKKATARPSPKEFQITVIAYTYKTYIFITKHKIDIRTFQKHRCNTIPIFRHI